MTALYCPGCGVTFILEGPFGDNDELDGNGGDCPNCEPGLFDLVEVHRHAL